MMKLADAEARKKWLMKEALRGGTDDIKRRREWARQEKEREQEAMKAVWAHEEKKFAVNEKAFKTRLIDRLGWQEKVANQYKQTVQKENQDLVRQRQEAAKRQEQEQTEVQRRMAAAEAEKRRLMVESTKKAMDDQYLHKAQGKFVDEEE
jgi:asparagine synthetase B (glutamine-hydrolysing)